MVIPVFDVDKKVLRKPTYEELKEIVYTITSLVDIGFVTTYKSIASILDIHPRLVARILKENEKPIIIPCHRVIKSNRDISGYSLGGRVIKRKLLEIEGVVIDNNDKVDKKHVIDISELLNDR